MFRTLSIAATVCLIALTAAAQPSSGKDAITDLAYSAQPDQSLYFIGQYQGKPVNLVRKGAAGSGSWTIYTGTMSDRVRLTFDDKKGLQEILAMDKGQRITLNQVGKERIEYRLYAPDRRFIIASVLYRKDNCWLQGLMKTEAFAGYPALINVSDVTDSVTVQGVNSAGKISLWIKDQWKNLELIPSAYAEGDDNPGVSGSFWSAPGNEMWKGMLVGASAFTVKLIAAADTVAIGGGVAVATPFLVTVGVGVTIGLAADKVYNWASSKNLGSATSVTDFYNRLVAKTVFSNQSAPEVPLPAVADAPEKTFPSQATTARQSVNRPEADISMSDLLALSEQGDKQDFRIALDIVDLCTRKRDFACTELQINTATKLANGSDDKQALAAARQKIAAEKRRISEEERLRAENERLAAEAAERQRIAQAQERAAQERAAQERQSGGFQWGKAGALLAGASIGGLGKLSSDVQADVITGILKDSMEGQEGMGNVDTALRAHQATDSPALAAAATPRSQGSGTWHDNYSTTVTQTGETKSDPNHEGNIPDDVIASSVKDRASAAAVWPTGKVVDYSGSLAAGEITVVVDYGYIRDTHVYTRDP